MKKLLFGMLLLAVGTTSSQADIVHGDDVIINNDIAGGGSLCNGGDCVNGEAFGFDTTRLKENNLRIHFDDTSTGTFPLNDWRIFVNDSASGGLSRFSIQDSTGGTFPFTIEAGARANALYVESTGDVGIGTSNPVVDIHSVRGDTPALRLEQDGSSGFTPQTWDVAGNEVNFFIRDATNGSTLPIRLRPGAPSSSIDIAGTGDVGMGIASPTSSLHVERNDGTAQILVEETNATVAPRTLFQLDNPGNTKFVINNTDAAVEWGFTNEGTEFRISRQTSGVVELALDNNGNLTIQGTLTEMSSRSAKHDIEAVDPQVVLSKVVELPLAEWTYNHDAEVRHLGPMAEDFAAAFGLGATDTGVATIDTSGVALAAIQGLHQQARQKDTEIEALRTELNELKVLLQTFVAKDKVAATHAAQ